MWVIFFFFFNDPAPPEIYPLPLPAPLPILDRRDLHDVADLEAIGATRREDDRRKGDESSIGIQNRLQRGDVLVAGDVFEPDLAAVVVDVAADSEQSARVGDRELTGLDVPARLEGVHPW